MKKTLFVSFCLMMTAVLSFGLVFRAHVNQAKAAMPYTAAFSWETNIRNATDDGPTNKYMYKPEGTVNAFAGVIGSNGDAVFYVCGTGLSCVVNSATDAVVTVANVPQASITGLSAVLASLSSGLDEKEPALPSGNSGQYIGGDKMLHTVPSPGPMIYNNQNVKTSAKIWTGTATVTSGVATFYPTDDNSATGTAIFSTIYSTFVTAASNTASAVDVPLASIKVVASDKKSVTVNAITGRALLLLGDTVEFAPNGTAVNLTIFGE